MVRDKNSGDWGVNQPTLIIEMRFFLGTEVPRSRRRFFSMRKSAAVPIKPPITIDPQASNKALPV
jgi:hypothetical protein